jgi:hypothetical protein
MSEQGLVQADRTPPVRGQNIDLTSEPGAAHVVIGSR